MIESIPAGSFCLAKCSLSREGTVVENYSPFYPEGVLCMKGT